MEKERNIKVLDFFVFIKWLFVKSCAKVRFIETVVNTLTLQKTVKFNFRHKILFCNYEKK